MSLPFFKWQKISFWIVLCFSYECYVFYLSMVTDGLKYIDCIYTYHASETTYSQPQLFLMYVKIFCVLVWPCSIWTAIKFVNLISTLFVYKPIRYIGHTALNVSQYLFLFGNIISKDINFILKLTLCITLFIFSRVIVCY